MREATRNNQHNKIGRPIEKPWLHYITSGDMPEECPKMSIYQLLKSNTASFPEKTALIYLGTRISFGEMLQHIQEFANSLQALGVKAGDIVPIISSNTPETAYALYALNYIGAIPDLEYATISENGAVQAVDSCHAKVAIVLDQLLPGIAEITECESLETIIVLPVSESMPWHLRIICDIKYPRRKKYGKQLGYRDFIKMGTGVVASEHPYREGSMAVIVHSGGTTGKPKGVMLSNENLVFMYWGVNHNFEYTTPDDVGMCFIPVFHAFGLCLGFVAPISGGMTLILSPKFDEKFLHCLYVKNRPNHVVMGASHVNNWMANEQIRKSDLSYLKTMCYGGSGLTTAKEQELDEFLKSRHASARPMGGYGMSETSSAAIVERNSYYGKVGSTGIPFPGVDIRIIDTETGKDLSYNETGELCIASPGLMLGYFQDEEETNNAIFTDNDGTRWIHTGDLAYIDEDGFVFITGRIKRIYSTRSGPNSTIFKLFPDYITNIIANVDNVQDCVVTCLKNEKYLHIAVAFVILNNKNLREETEEAVWTALRKEFPSHCLPKAILLVDEIPKTSVGKPDWNELEVYAMRNM